MCDDNSPMDAIAAALAAISDPMLAFAVFAEPFRADAVPVARFLDAAAETLRAEAERQGAPLQ